MKVVGKILAVIICILYFFVLTGLMLLMFSRSLLSGDYYASVLEDVDLNTIKISDMGELFEGSGFDDDMSVQDALVKSLADGGVEKKKAVAIVEDKELRTIVGNFVGDYINYKLGGQEPKISKSDVETVMKNPNFVSIAGESTQTDIDKAYNQLDDIVKEMLKDGGAKNGDFKRSNEVVKIPQR